MKATKIFIKSKFGDIPTIRYDQNTMEPGRKYAIVIFAHGLGERGDGTLSGLSVLERSTHHANLLKAADARKDFIVIAPQFVSKYLGDQHQRSFIGADYMDYVVKWVKQQPETNTLKVGMTGFSEGGGMCWNYATAKQEYAEELSFLMPIAGANLEQARNWEFIADANLPVWAFHAMDDGVPYQITRDYVATINAVNADPKAIATLYKTGGHFVADDAYGDAKVIEWAIAQQNDKIVTPEPPTKKVLTKIYFPDGEVMTVFDDKTTLIEKNL